MANAEDSNTTSVWLNPLRIWSFDDVGTERGDTGSVLRDLCRDYTEDPLQGMRERYIRLTECDCSLFAVPADKRILDKIVWPLHSAKRCYCMADHLGCIALCGVVCEMAVIFIYDLLAKSPACKTLAQDQRELFRKRKYENLGQEKRIANLRLLSLVNPSLLDQADVVRKLRREYLHFLEKSHKHLAQDAVSAYAAAFAVVSALVALPIANSRLVVPNHLDSYLRAKRLL